MNGLNKNQRIKVIPVFLMLGLVLLVIRFSYSFFIYNKTGLYAHIITGGKMKVIYDEVTGNNITIENAYPLTDEEALTKALEFEFTVTGYNESDKNVYYAIEIDRGEEVENKTRFKDTDIKLTLYENDDLYHENEIFNSLDNQDIYYGYIRYGTSSESPTVNNYKMRLWINDNVIISDTIENINSRYDSATVKADLTLDNQRSVKGWIEESYYNENFAVQCYALYIASEGNTYLTDCSYMFYDCPKLVGAISYDSSKTDVTYANPDTGYFTRKSA